MAVSLEAIRQVETGSNGHKNGRRPESIPAPASLIPEWIFAVNQDDLFFYQETVTAITHELNKVIPKGELYIHHHGDGHYPVEEFPKGYLHTQIMVNENGEPYSAAYGYKMTLIAFDYPDKPFEVYIFAGQNKHLVVRTSTGAQQPIRDGQEKDLEYAAQSLSSQLHRTYDPRVLAGQAEMRALVKELKQRAYENSLQAQLDRHQNA